MSFPFLDGKKTYIAAAIAALVAFNQIVPVLSPEMTKTLIAIATALGLWGVRHAIAKLEEGNDVKSGTAGK